MHRPWLAITIAACLTVALTAPRAAAQDRDDGAERKYVRLTPKEGGWKVKELFESINASTDRSILYDPKAQQIQNATVEFIGDAMIPEDELFQWLQAVLAYHKLVLVPVGPRGPDGEQQWFAMDQANPALQSRPVYVDESEIDKYADRDGLYVVTSINLVNITDTSRVRAALAQLATKTAAVGRVLDIQGSRSIIVADFAPMVAAVKRLVEFIDQPNPVIEPEMEVFHLKYAVASELEPILSDLIQTSRTVVQGGRQPRGATSSLQGPEPKIIADPRLDALIVYATLTDRDKIRELIEQLDVPNTNYRQRLHFRPLKHTDAVEMQDLLEELISGTSTSSSRRTTPGTRTTRRPTGGAQPATPFGGGATGEGDPVIIADTISNSLIIHASPTQFDDIDDLITKLDQSRPQVLIETALVELALSDTLDVGVELFGAESDIAVDTDGDGVADTLTEASKYFSLSSFGLSTTTFTDVNGVMVPTARSPAIGTGATVGIFSGGELPFLLSAFRSSGRAKILTMPSVVTNDNQRATLELRRETSFRENIRDDTGTNRDTFQTVEASTLLSISPHISSDNYLRLEIEQTVENFGGRPSPDAPPDQTMRRIETNVTVPDQYTVVLGGLIQEEERSTVRKVPFLGDIPIIGILFRQTTDESNPQHLFLFVTPRILRDTEHFRDYHKLTWERKLLQDDLFRDEVTFPGSRFQGAAPPKTTAEQIKRIEQSGELDAGRLKAAPSTAERRKQAADSYRRKKADEDAGDETDDNEEDK